MNFLKLWKILAVSIILVLFCGCEEEIPHSSMRSADMPDEQSDSVTMITMDKDVVTMQIIARHIDRYYKRKETLIDSLFLQSYDENGSLKSTLTCQTARINESSNVIVCTGDVVVNSENGKLETPKLTWDRDTDKVKAEDGVKLTRGDDILWGERMRTDMHLDNIEIVKVSAAGTVKGEGIEW